MNIDEEEVVARQVIHHRKPLLERQNDAPTQSHRAPRPPGCDIECWSCGQIGHFRSSCPTSPKAGNVKRAASLATLSQAGEEGDDSLSSRAKAESPRVTTIYRVPVFFRGHLIFAVFEVGLLSAKIT